MCLRIWRWSKLLLFLGGVGIFLFFPKTVKAACPNFTVGSVKKDSAGTALLVDVRMTSPAAGKFANKKYSTQGCTSSCGRNCSGSFGEPIEQTDPGTSNYSVKVYYRIFCGVTKITVNFDWISDTAGCPNQALSASTTTDSVTDYGTSYCENCIKYDVSSQGCSSTNPSLCGVKDGCIDEADYNLCDWCKTSGNSSYWYCKAISVSCDAIRSSTCYRRCLVGITCSNPPPPVGPTLPPPPPGTTATPAPEPTIDPGGVTCGTNASGDCVCGHFGSYPESSADMKCDANGGFLPLGGSCCGTCDRNVEISGFTISNDNPMPGETITLGGKATTTLSGSSVNYRYAFYPSNVASVSIGASTGWDCEPHNWFKRTDSTVNGNWWVEVGTIRPKTDMLISRMHIPLHTEATTAWDVNFAITDATRTVSDNNYDSDSNPEGVPHTFVLPGNSLACQPGGQRLRIVPGSGIAEYRVDFNVRPKLTALQNYKVWARSTASGAGQDISLVSCYGPEKTRVPELKVMKDDVAVVAGGDLGQAESGVSGMAYEKEWTVPTTLVPGTTYTVVLEAGDSESLVNDYIVTNGYASYASASLEKNIVIAPPAPTFSDLEIENVSGKTLPPEWIEGQKYNEICDDEYFTYGTTGYRTVLFTLAFEMLTSGADIDKVIMSLDTYLDIGVSGLSTGTTKTSISGSESANINLASPGINTWVSGTTRYLTIPIEFLDNFRQGTYSLLANAYSKQGNTNLYSRDTGRQFRVWDCKVNIQGTVYDGSAVTPVCSLNLGFTDQIDKAGANLTSLDYAGVGNSQNKSMVIDVVNPTYSDGGDSNRELIFGLDFRPDFNDDANFASPVLKVVNVGTGVTYCPVTDVVSLKKSTGLIDPYSDNPIIQVNFSALVNQEPWYQLVGGGVRAKTDIIDQIPVTCEEATKAITIGSTTGAGVGETNNGMVTAVSVVSGQGVYGIPLDMGVNRNTVAVNDEIKFAEVYDKYFRKLGQGREIVGNASMSTIGTGSTGVVLVRGNLTVDVGNSLSSGQFLMVGVSGSITVDRNVDRMAGVYFADGTITFGSSTPGEESDAQLVVEGSMYTNGDVRMLRNLDSGQNNTTPAVVVKYRPDLVFSIPEKLTEILSGWREGL
ncbi:MAG: hypothetical protein WC686_04750 [Candidatus Shapirobacteria bacterium]